jgi:hypothetical protein
VADDIARATASVAGHTAHVRTSTILVPTAPGTYCGEVRSRKLDEAVLRDSERGGAGEPSENPDRGEAEPAGPLL